MPFGNSSWERDDGRFLEGLQNRENRQVLIDDYNHERKLFSIMALLAGFFLLADILHSFAVHGHPTRNLSSGGGLVLLFLLNLVLSYRADTLVKMMKALDALSAGTAQEDDRP